MGNNLVNNTPSIPVDDLVQVIPLEQAADLLDLLSPIVGAFRTLTFRGQADASWGLVPSAFRAIDLRRKREACSQSLTIRKVIEVEQNLLRTFVEAADRQGLQIPFEIKAMDCQMWGIRNSEDWPQRDLLPALALAQHSGVPTRLLDWTKCSFVAAYFAASAAAELADQEGRFAVWVHNSCHWEVGGALRDLVEVVRLPFESNANMRIQKGMFLLVRSREELDSDFVCSRLEKSLAEAVIASEGGTAPIFTKITLPKREAPLVLELLDQFGISAESLFNGYEGPARAAKMTLQDEPSESSRAQFRGYVEERDRLRHHRLKSQHVTLGKGDVIGNPLLPDAECEPCMGAPSHLVRT